MPPIRPELEGFANALAAQGERFGWSLTYTYAAGAYDITIGNGRNGKKRFSVTAAELKDPADVDRLLNWFFDLFEEVKIRRASRGRP